MRQNHCDLCDSGGSAEQGGKVSPFKCGPDYIDPVLHAAAGREAHNLDGFFCAPERLCGLLSEYGGELAVLEGVMGFYDGGEGAAHAVSEATGTPAVLVVDSKGLSESLGAVMQGFLHYRPNLIAGFLFNRLPESLVSLAKRLCDELGTGYFGYLPQGAPGFGSRHLGLFTAEEISVLQEKLQALSALAEKHILLDKLLALSAAPLSAMPEITPLFRKEKPVIAVAKDSAFCFRYAENLHLLEKLGCEIVYFSPISDIDVPEADGLLLCGGTRSCMPGRFRKMSPYAVTSGKSSWPGCPALQSAAAFSICMKRLKRQKGSASRWQASFRGRHWPERSCGALVM